MEKNYIKPHVFVAAGFSAVILLLLFIIILWKYNETVSEQQDALIAKQQKEYQAVMSMMHIAHRRAISLYKMSTLTDPFARDSEFMRFRSFGEKFIKNRELLANSNLTEKEKTIWERIKEILNQGGKIQYKVVEMIEGNRYDAATMTLATSLAPIQEKLHHALSHLVAVKEGILAKEKEKAAEIDNKINFVIYILCFAAVVLGVLTYVVTTRTAKTESELAKQAQRLRALYEVISQSDLSLADQINETLKVGCRLFGLDIGKLCRIDPKTGTNTFIDVVTSNTTDSILKKGMVVPLERTFCSIPYNEETIVAINNIATSEHKSYPCYEFANLGAYVAAPVSVFGEKYGTINFSSFKSRAKPFTQSDQDLLDLIGRWVSVNIECQASQQMQIDKKVAEDADKAKSRFLANMSHELRTPLNAIIGYSEILIDDFLGESDEAVNDLNKIRQSGRHLLNLVDNVLDLTKIEAGKTEVVVEFFTLDSLLQAVVETVKPLVARNNNQLRVSISEQIESMRSDPTKLKQILLNLLSNAAKFTENGEIELKVFPSQRGGREYLEFVVSDTGIGIAADALETIFDEFSQEDATTAVNYGGSGLGLSICRKFSLMLGGDVTVSSSKGKGSEFRLSLPRWHESRQSLDAVKVG